MGIASVQLTAAQFIELTLVFPSLKGKIAHDPNTFNGVDPSQSIALQSASSPAKYAEINQLVSRRFDGLFSAYLSVAG